MRVKILAYKALKNSLPIPKNSLIFAAISTANNSFRQDISAQVAASDVIDSIRSALNQAEFEKFDKKFQLQSIRLLEKQIDTMFTQASTYKEKDDYDLALDEIYKIEKIIKSFESKSHFPLTPKLKKQLSDALTYMAEYCTALESDRAVKLYEEAYHYNAENKYALKSAHAIRRSRGKLLGSMQQVEVIWPEPLA